jgi:hypothetical protein
MEKGNKELKIDDEAEDEEDYDNWDNMMKSKVQ